MIKLLTWLCGFFPPQCVLPEPKRKKRGRGYTRK